MKNSRDSIVMPHGRTPGKLEVVDILPAFESGKPRDKKTKSPVPNSLEKILAQTAPTAASGQTASRPAQFETRLFVEQSKKIAEPEASRNLVPDFGSQSTSDHDAVAPVFIVAKYNLQNKTVKRLNLWRLLGFAMSFASHVSVLILLSLFYLRAMPVETIVSLELAPDVAVDDVPLVELVPDVVPEQVDMTTLEEADTQADSGVIALDALFAETDLESGKSVAKSEGTSVGAGTTRGKKPERKKAKFFGNEIDGNRIVFVLDRSGSMRRAAHIISTKGIERLRRRRITGNSAMIRFDVATEELVWAINRLEPHQEFYVVLFASELSRMFGNTSTPVLATPENKRKLQRWLTQVSIEGNTDPRDALSAAFEVDPDVMFLLSDGEFDSDADDDGPHGTMAVLKTLNTAGVPIHTVAFEDKSSQRNMAEIASANHGNFTFVTVQEYLRANLKSPDEEVRIKTLKKLSNVIDMTWEQRMFLALDHAMVWLEGDKSLEEKKVAINAMHSLGLGFFRESMPELSKRPTPEEFAALASKWRKIWSQADDLVINDMTTFRLKGRLAPKTVSAQDLNMSILLLSAFGYGEKKPLSQLADSDLEVSERLYLAGELAKYYSQYGYQQDSTDLFQLAIKLHPNPPEGATKWSNLLPSYQSVLSARKKASLHLFQEWQSADARDLKSEIALELVLLYPETSSAMWVKNHASFQDAQDASSQSAAGNEGQQ